jgi:hypothetical protein
VTDWFLLLPAVVCALATVICGHETINAARQGEFTPVGIVLTLACAVSTLIAFGAVLP